ncbi:uncharacterized protein EAF01_004872 [Botrytis porri]|uniref:uncharacterized protein n=1 Tax=Botrytis porri TaxID=87229 RepID=UPI0018FF8892|nr:uncharacterized protein EAF01_004872 [Botrytis porri]KAF7907285.1 hypothetical protein EAF01_004872 [Botrytis porri]
MTKYGIVRQRPSLTIYHQMPSIQMSQNFKRKRPAFLQKYNWKLLSQKGDGCGTAEDTLGGLKAQMRSY